MGSIKSDPEVDTRCVSEFPMPPCHLSLDERSDPAQYDGTRGTQKGYAIPNPLREPSVVIQIIGSTSKNRGAVNDRSGPFMGLLFFECCQ